MYDKLLKPRQSFRITLYVRFIFAGDFESRSIGMKLYQAVRNAEEV